ncbi:MAG TPA: phosphatidylinositol-specific phospholipase C/glycerophosphodiester phosphodiesterase family protein [Clostridia bacterium]|nr:phosphatidylinositol-specific phospholipase C/glycerophosphodiester phosphodiesterase family protein [Clostridia bacterium]
MRKLLPFLLVTFLGTFASIQAKDRPVVPLIQAHAHNDYLHKRPLLDALDHGFCSVEADIHLADGQLLVAHDRGEMKPGRTLQALYLEPLRARVKQNGGKVYPNGPEFTLLIDIKGDWETTYPVLREVLKQYADMLSSYQAGKKETRAVAVVISGNRSKAMFADESVRYAALDGNLDDLNAGEPADLMPWISTNWERSFRWRGSGDLSGPEKIKLRDLVTQAHQHGQRLRFWGAPDEPKFWKEMLANGVDLINSDDLPGLEKFLIKAGATATSPAPAPAR